MCNETENEIYEDKWNDYFDFVNTDVFRNLKYNEDVYIAYGAHNKLPVEDIRKWYTDAEHYLETSPEAAVARMYDNLILTIDDVEWFVDKAIEDGMLYENRGYWFST